MKLKPLGVTSDGKIYDKESGTVLNNYGVVTTNGGAISNAEGVNVTPTGIAKGVNNTINVVNWLIKNWQLSLLGALALLLLFKRI